VAISLKHKFTNPKSDGGDSTIVRPSNWNDEHDLTAASGKVLGTTTAGTTVTELPIAVTSGGLVGIGIDPPIYELHLSGTKSAADVDFWLENLATSGRAEFICAVPNATGGGAYGGFVTDGTNQIVDFYSNMDMRFLVGPSFTDRGRIRADGSAILNGTLDIGNADTTLSRLAARTLGVEGKALPYVFAQSGTAVSVSAVTSEETLATITIPGGAMGPNGWVGVSTIWSCNNDADAKTGRVRVGGGAGTAFFGVNMSSNVGLSRAVYVVNSNSASSQKANIAGGNAGGTGVFTSAAPTASVNTASDWDLVITGQKADSADTLTLEAYQVIICYGA
jgi:hypothetical protein